MPENTEPITKEGRGTSAYLIRSRSLDDNRWLLTPAGPGEFGVSAARRVRPIGCIEIIDSGKGRILRLSIVVCLGAFDSGRGGRSDNAAKFDRGRRRVHIEKRDRERQRIVVIISASACACAIRAAAAAAVSKVTDERRRKMETRRCDRSKCRKSFSRSSADHGRRDGMEDGNLQWQYVTACEGSKSAVWRNARYS